VIDFSTGMAAKTEPAANARRRMSVFFMADFLPRAPLKIKANLE
jgi:hypothetical protein